MRAVVLVGGFGTRLRPLTNDIPKPMLPIGHRPMITALAERLAAAGVSEVVLALGFRPEPFAAAFPDGHASGASVVYAVEPEPLDTGGAIKFAAEHAGIDDTFVVVNGDVVTDVDIRALVAAHREWGAEATIHLTPVDDPAGFGVVEVEPDGHVHRFVEKPAPGETASNLINAGTYVFEPSVLARIPAGRRVSIERETFPALVRDRSLFALATDDYWIDTGRPDLYRQANLDLVDRRRPSSCEPVGPGAHVAASATLDHSVVTGDAHVGDHVRLIESVILPGADIGRGALVERSIVMGRVGADAVVRDSVVGASGEVAAGGALIDARLPEPV